MAKYINKRSGVAVAAQHRNAGYMRHRNQPRGGARNVQAELLDEHELDQEYDAATRHYWDE
jgi:hypothetical protein